MDPLRLVLNDEPLSPRHAHPEERPLARNVRAQRELRALVESTPRPLRPRLRQTVLSAGDRLGLAPPRGVSIRRTESRAGGPLRPARVVALEQLSGVRRSEHNGSVLGSRLVARPRPWLLRKEPRGRV